MQVYSSTCAAIALSDGRGMAMLTYFCHACRERDASYANPEPNELSATTVRARAHMFARLREARPVLSKKRLLVLATRAGRDRMAGASRSARVASGLPSPNAARACGGFADGWSRRCLRSISLS